MRKQHLLDYPEHWKPVAAVFSALGDETRQKILLLFEKGEDLSIKDIAACFPLGRTTIVHHLRKLESAGILTARRQRGFALYSIRPAVILDALEKLRLFIDEELSETCRQKEPGKTP
ncbi:MAG: metalloregulator ArsR/SmtB family transcription factor [Desulfovibrio sp.]|jgi:DNA-binding transcriptional ArsR family regulator|nr:metalloregulator ArsR/SmtB family transcription factor [Desulfovibrio sp.]